MIGVLGLSRVGLGQVGRQVCLGCGLGVGWDWIGSGWVWLGWGVRLGWVGGQAGLGHIVGWRWVSWGWVGLGIRWGRVRLWVGSVGVGLGWGLDWDGLGASTSGCAVIPGSATPTAGQYVQKRFVFVFV